MLEQAVLDGGELLVSNCGIADDECEVMSCRGGLGRFTSDKMSNRADLGKPVQRRMRFTIVRFVVALSPVAPSSTTSPTDGTRWSPHLPTG